MAVRRTSLLLSFIVAGVSRVALAGPTLTTLVTFTGPNGNFPNNGLIADAAGNLYGTTTAGGSVDSRQCPNGHCGTVFKVTTSGVESWVPSFVVVVGLPGCPDPVVWPG